jgi:ABC-type Fe3+/spermidine/putrescine transport system ATPase subunit
MIMLEVSDIDLHYGAAQALRGISLKAEAGKVTCVLGRNGVGKTSLLRAIVGQHPVSKGSIFLDGTDITGLSTVSRARSGIGFVPQGREIFPLLTVEENLETGFAPLPREERDVPNDVFSLFPVLSSMLKRRGGDLSYRLFLHAQPGDEGGGHQRRDLARHALPHQREHFVVKDFAMLYRALQRLVRSDGHDLFLSVRFEKIPEHPVSVLGQDRLGMELHALDGELAMAYPHHFAVVSRCCHREARRHRCLVDRE